MAGTDTLTEKKITRQEAGDFVKSRSWYQTIDFGDDLISNGCAWCGEPAWKNIIKFLPKSLEGMRILDLGCNAGLFCVKAALMGAKEVVGVDWPGWRPGWDFVEQQQFVKDFFENKYDRKLPIAYISERMEDFLRGDIGYFDYAFAIASIYYTEDPAEVVHNISLRAENVIVRLREENIISRFSRLFSYAGYLEQPPLREEWWEKLKTPTDDFYLFLYTKNRNVAYYKLKSGQRLNIWQLMNFVGTEIPVEQYRERIPQEDIEYIPVDRLRSAVSVLTEEQRSKYPWDPLVASIKDRGFVIPLIVEEFKDGGYVILEGKHRAAAAMMIDHTYKVPCVVVRNE